MARTKASKKDVKPDISKSTNKKSAKSTEKSKKGPEREVKKSKRKIESYGSYLYRVLKSIHPDTGISSKAMGIMNDLMNDLFERLASEASGLAKISKTSTLGYREIETAVKLIIPGELAKHGVHEAKTAYGRYQASYDKKNNNKNEKKMKQDSGDDEDEEEEEEDEDNENSE